MNYNSTVSYRRRRSSRSTSTNIFMFIVCTLMIAIGVLIYLKKQDETSDGDTPGFLAENIPATVTPDEKTNPTPNPIPNQKQQQPNNQQPKPNQQQPNNQQQQPNNQQQQPNNQQQQPKPNQQQQSINQQPKPNQQQQSINQQPKPNQQLKPNNQQPKPNQQQQSINQQAKPNLIENSSQDKKIVIKAKDNLWDICHKEYKNGSYYLQVINYNQSKYNNPINPNQLKQGRFIYLPPISYFKSLSKNQGNSSIEVTKTQKSNSQVKKGSDRLYVIKKGDIPFKISQKEYGNGKYAQSIIDYNNAVYHLNLDAKKLQPGREIYLPSKEYFANNETVHIVKENETLYKISEKYYKTHKYVPELQKYNNISEISKLQINQIVRIPSLATIQKMSKTQSSSTQRKSNKEDLNNFQLIAVQKFNNTWDLLSKYYHIPKHELIKCNDSAYKEYPKQIPEAFQIKIPIKYYNSIATSL